MRGEVAGGFDGADKISVIVTTCGHDINFLNASITQLRHVSKDIIFVARDRLVDGKTQDDVASIAAAVAAYPDVC